ncbi:MAG: hypothetical protein QOD86_1150 [Miltoncostaeaceae bacterium]|jgi:hypothetical protein|nr:hypothetical protein [Miltoncostaeaceae bacterium]
MSSTTTSAGPDRRRRRIVPWLAGLGIATTFGTAAILFLLEALSYLDDNTYTPTPTIAPEVLAGAGAVALLACLPRLSGRARTWGWSLSGVVAYFTVASADWLADGSLIASPVLPLLAALSGGALLVAGALLAYSGACARSSAVPAA